MRHLFKLTLSIALLSFAFNTYGQNDGFEGTVRYSMDMGVKKMSPEEADMLKNSEIITQIKNEHSRTESKTPMGSSVMVSNNKDHTGFTLLDMMGFKCLIRTKPEDIKKYENRPDVKIKELPETKIIAGYKCKKAELTVTDTSKKEHKSTIFYTTDIPSNKNYGNTFKGLKGFPLEYTMDAGHGEQVKLIVKSVIKEKLDDSIFLAPVGYKELTQEELQKEMMKSFGGGGQ
jgi:GLPGLI family protein